MIGVGFADFPDSKGLWLLSNLLCYVTWHYYCHYIFYTGVEVTILGEMTCSVEICALQAIKKSKKIKPGLKNEILLWKHRLNCIFMGCILTGIFCTWMGLVTFTRWGTNLTLKGSELNHTAPNVNIAKENCCSFWERALCLEVRKHTYCQIKTFTKSNMALISGPLPFGFQRTTKQVSD